MKMIIPESESSKIKIMNTNISMTAKLSALGLTIFLGLVSFVPQVSAQHFTLTSCNSATLHGHVITNGTPTDAQFEWGPGSSITHSTPVQHFNNDSDYSQVLTGLNENSTYSFRTRVFNDIGSHTSDSLSFTTGNCNNSNPSLPQPTVDIRAADTNIPYNNGTTILWDSQNATSCSATGGTNNWSGSRPTSGVFGTGALINTTTYSITCTNASGQATDSVTVNVSGQQAQQPTVDVTADNTNVSFNGATTVRWTSNNANSCSASGGSNGWSGSRSTSGSFSTGNLSNTITYNITCTNSAGSSASDSVTVNVSGQNNNNNTQQVSVDITADDTNIDRDSSTIVRWTSNNANSCSSSGGSNGWSTSNRGTNGSFNTGRLNNNVTYTITCSNNNGSASDSVTVRVDGNNNSNAGDVNVDIWADDTSIQSNSSTMIRWTSTNADTCEATSGTSGWRGTRGRSGSFNTGNLTNTVTYTITCENDDDSDSDSVTVNVNGGNGNTSGLPTVFLTADHFQVSRNSSTILRWNSSNANSCLAYGGTGNWAGTRGVTGTFNTGSLTNTLTYYISCSNSAGSTYDSVTITVNGGQTFVQNTTTYIPPAQTSVMSLASAIDIIGCACENMANSGSEILYTLTYNNNSNTTIRNARISINLPPEASYVSSAPYNASVSGNTLTFNIGNIAANGQGSVMVRARSRDGMVNGSNVTFNSNLNYTSSNGNQLTVNDSVSAQLPSYNQNFASNNVNGNGMASAAATGLTSALSTGAAGWLLLVILVLLIIVLVRHILTQSKERKTIITTTNP